MTMDATRETRVTIGHADIDRPTALTEQGVAAAPARRETNALLRPYEHVPARIDLYAVNPKTAYGAARSARMDFSGYDRVDDFELNEVLWRSIKGAEAALPPAVRRAIADRPVARD